jgi:hypothetical protein
MQGFKFCLRRFPCDKDSERRRGYGQLPGRRNGDRHFPELHTTNGSMG